MYIRIMYMYDVYITLESKQMNVFQSYTITVSRDIVIWSLLLMSESNTNSANHLFRIPQTSKISLYDDNAY